MSKLSFPKIMTGCFHFMPHRLVKKKKKHFDKRTNHTTETTQRDLKWTADNEKKWEKRTCFRWLFHPGSISVIKSNFHEFVVAEGFVMSCSAMWNSFCFMLLWPLETWARKSGEGNDSSWCSVFKCMCFYLKYLRLCYRLFLKVVW